MKERWVTVALTNDALVAELLLRLKQSPPSDSSHAPTTPATTASTLAPPVTTAALVLPAGWGHHKSRSRPNANASTASATVSASVAKQQQQQQHQRGSPTTPLSWSGGGGASTSDGYDDCSRPSDLSSGGRSNKAGFGNEGATTSSYKKSRKRKSFAELKEEEGFLLKERVHLNKELASMRVSLNQQMATSENLKRIKIDLHQSPTGDAERTQEQLAWSRMKSEAEQCVQKSCKVEAEAEAENRERGFILPDLNMMPCDEELAAMS